MNDNWWTNGCLTWSMLLLIGIFQLNFIFSWSLNNEGIALFKFKERVVNDPYGGLSSWNEENGNGNPCSWFGIGCVDGHVVSLNLKNLCLEGSLAPELHCLLHLKSIILRNNSFSGFIPGEYRNLKELELLDLGYNKLCEPFRYEFEHNIPVLLLDNNGLSCHISPDLEDTTLPEVKNKLSNSVEVLPYLRHNNHAEVGRSRILQDHFPNKTQAPSGRPSPSDEKHTGRDDSATSPNEVNPSFDLPSPPSRPSSHNKPHSGPLLSPPPPPPPPRPTSPSADVGSRNNLIPIVAGAVGGFIGLILIALLIFLLRGIKIRKATVLSGQLKRAFVPGNDRSDGLTSDKPSFIEGMPNLKRSELVTACEDFSNVIGSSSIGTIYKGTLSNGLEIAVISLVATSAKDWSKNLETQFRKKIETLSKVNHKNFVNIVGYCEEEEPFTRIMVFEYAPNGSLFEHLHVREAEHLDWGMRLRVAMGMAYCLEHMHQLTPPVTHPNLNSSAVNLSEDYAAKISDFCFWNEVAAPRVQPLAISTSSLSATSVSPESNVCSFGLLLLEMMTGRIPHSSDYNSLDDWVLEYMRGEQPLKEMVDPMLRHYKPEQLDKISEVIRKCLHTEQNRPTMIDVTARLKEITGIIQDKAVPRFSSLWWTELDTRSVNGT